MLLTGEAPRSGKDSDNYKEQLPVSDCAKQLINTFLHYKIVEYTVMLHILSILPGQVDVKTRLWSLRGSKVI